MPIVSHRARVLGAVAAFIAVAFMLYDRGGGRSTGSAESDPPLMPRPSANPEHPAPPAPMRGLPPLAHSDAAIREALRRIGGAESLLPLLAPEDLVRRFVVAVHGASGPSLPSRLYPVVGPADAAAAPEPWEHAVLTHADFRRYEPYVRALESVDTRRLVALYVRFYPLLQQAYGDIEGGRAYFNDRLVHAIDDVVAAPAPAMPIPIVLRDGQYRFEDPTLEERSAGQKLLMRMGPENAARVKAKLREIRKLLGLRGPPAVH